LTKPPAALRIVVLGSIPGGARDAKIVAEEQNPVSINRQPSYAITAIYRFYDQDYVVSILRKFGRHAAARTTGGTQGGL